MSPGAKLIKYDPIKPLLDSGNDAVAFFTRRDLLGQNAGPIERVWQLPDARRILARQLPDGSWKYPGKQGGGTGVKYGLVETWKQMRYLIDQYGMDRTCPGVSRAADFIFSCQTVEGDIRGILANQYAPYYTGAIMSLLIKAGYRDDPRIKKGFRWLLRMRQDDGGWVIGSPGIVGLGKLSRAQLIDLTSSGDCDTAGAFDRSKPFSAAGTGMVLRAFAAHPDFCRSEHAINAANLLKSKMMNKDNWPSYGHPDNWLRFQFPFWWTNLASALDTLTLMGFTAEDDDVRRGLEWLISHQQPDGLWKVSYSDIHKTPENSKSLETRIWITLAICRILKRGYG